MSKVCQLVSTVIIAVIGLAMPLETAQSQIDSCPATVTEALSTLNTVCDGLGRNQVCYASNRVTAAFYEDIDVESFTAPSDTVELTALRTISTAPQGVDADEWGVAIMSVQANLPNTLPGQGVIFVLVGDTTLENAVTPEEAVVLADALPGTVNTGANVRSGPGTNFNVVGSLAADAALGVDARNADGSWLRLTLNESTVGWIFADLVTVTGDTSALPVLDGRQFSPMQAFVMETGVGRPDCSEAPSKLLVQSPQDVTVDLRVNGVDVTVASTVVFDNPDGQALRIGVLEGRATIQQTGTIIPAGFTARQSVAETFDDTTTEDPVAIFTDLEPIDDALFEEYDVFDDLDDDFFNYEIELDTFEEAFFDDLETFEEEFFGVVDDDEFFDEDFGDYCDEFPDDEFCTDDFSGEDFEDYCDEFPNDEFCTDDFGDEFFDEDFGDYCDEFPNDEFCTDDFDDDFSDDDFDDFSDDDFDDFDDEDF